MWTLSDKIKDCMETIPLRVKIKQLKCDVWILKLEREFWDGAVGLVGGAAVRLAGGGAAPAVGGRAAQPVRDASPGLADAVLAVGWEVLHYL